MSANFSYETFPAESCSDVLFQSMDFDENFSSSSGDSISSSSIQESLEDLDEVSSQESLEYLERVATNSFQTRIIPFFQILLAKRIEREFCQRGNPLDVLPCSLWESAVRIVENQEFEANENFTLVNVFQDFLLKPTDRMIGYANLIRVVKKPSVTNSVARIFSVIRENNQKHFGSVLIERARSFRRFLRENNFRKILVPRSSLIRGNVVEENLTLKRRSFRMGELKRLGSIVELYKYAENYVECKEAVLEFSRLLLRYLDVKTFYSEMFSTEVFSEVPCYRRDLFPFYEENGCYKIVINDFGKVRFLENKRLSREGFFKEIQILIHLFPFHYNEIKKVVFECTSISFFRRIGVHRLTEKVFDEVFLIEKERALRVFQILYFNHLEVLQRYNIGLENPFYLPLESIGNQFFNSIKEEILGKVRNMFMAGCSSYFLGSFESLYSADEMFVRFESIEEILRNEWLLKIFNKMVAFVFKKQSSELMREWESPYRPKSNTDLLCIRSMFIKTPEAFFDELANECPIFYEDHRNSKKFIVEVVHIIFQKLQENGILSCYIKETGEPYLHGYFF